MASISLIERYSIWLADVPFREINESKVRPVLVIDFRSDNILCVPMTSQHPKTANDFELTQWRDAGLHMPTVAKTDTKLILSPEVFVKQIGVLHANDISLLRVMYAVNL